MNTDKTRVYIERSKSSPLELSLCDYSEAYYLKDALILAVPHLKRVVSINIAGDEDALEDFIEHFSCATPLLRYLIIDFTPCDAPPILSDTLFDGGVSSLSLLSLRGVVPRLPWNNLPNLTAFSLSNIPEGEISLTKLLDLFANAASLKDILLGSIPDSSDASPGRVVSLPRLGNLTIFANRVRSSVVLNHLSLPTGAFLYLFFCFDGEESPLPEFLPETAENLKNISCITSAYLFFIAESIHIQLGGLSGGLCIQGLRDEHPRTFPAILGCRIIRSLERFDLSRTERLAITMDESSPLDITYFHLLHHVLGIMKELRVLFINSCNNLLFLFALNPNRCLQKQTLCPKLESIVLYVGNKEAPHIRELTDMAKERASGGTQLQSITVIRGDEPVPEEEVFELREHVARVECRLERVAPAWNSIPNHGNS